MPHLASFLRPLRGLALGLAPLGIALPAALTLGAPALQAAEPASAEEVLRITSFDLLPRTIHEMGEIFASAEGGPVPAGAAGIWAAHFPPDAVLEEMRRSTRNALPEEDAQALIAWSRTPVGAAASGAERAHELKPRGVREAEEAAAAAALSPARRDVLAAMVEEMHAVDLTLSISRAFSRAMLQGMMAAGGQGQIALQPGDLDAILDQLMAGAAAETREGVLGAFAAAYAPLDDAALAEVRRFWNGPSGQTVLGVLFGAARNVLLRRAEAVGQELGRASRAQEL